MENISDRKDNTRPENMVVTEKQENPPSDGESCACVTSFRYKASKFRSNAIYRDKVIYSTCFFASFFITGWGKSMFGPAYIDLRLISGTDLKQGSWILTSVFIGYALGSILQGILYNRVNRKLIFSACLFMWSVTMTVIPWCSQFEAMLIGYIIFGVMQGILQTAGTLTLLVDVTEVNTNLVDGLIVDIVLHIKVGGNAELLQVWERKGRIAVLRMHLLYASGSVVGPIVVAPFLMDQQQSNTTSHGLNNRKMTLNLSFTEHTLFIPMPNSSNCNLTNISDDRFLDTADFQSDIYIPFSLIAGLSFVCCVMYFISNAKYSTEHKQKREGTTRKERKLPFRIKTFSLATIGAMFFFYSAIAEAYLGFLSTYCVEYFHWSKQEAAILNSVLYIFVLVARVLTIFFEKRINTLVFIGVHLVLMFLSVLGLLVVSLYQAGRAAWFFAPMFGFSTSCFFAMLFNWSNEYIIPITGGVSAYYFVSSTIGSAINPVLLGYLMEDQPVWFCYLFLIEIVIAMVLFVLGSLATKYIVRNHGYTFDTEPDIIKTDKSENEEFI